MWTFLNPLFLWAGLAAVIPLVLHLFQRRKIVRVPFSTLRFLKLAERKSTSCIRLENLLLWLLRTLLVLFLVLAFAGPVIRTTGLGRWAPASRRDIAIVVDGSASMHYETGFLRVWETVRQTAAQRIRELRPGDRASLFLAFDAPRPLIEQPTSDTELLLTLLNAQKPQPTTSRLKPAFEAARQSLRDSGTREREIYLLTDGQAMAWRDFLEEVEEEPKAAEEAADRRTTVFILLAGAEQPENATPFAASLEPTFLRANQAARIKASIRFSGAARPTSAALLVDDQEVARRTVDPGEGTQQEIVFPIPPLAAGRHAVRIELPPDPLALDDVLLAVIHVRDQLPVLLVGRDRDLFFIARALNPPDTPSGLIVHTADPLELADQRLTDYACLFLCNAIPLPGQALQAVEHYVRNGGTAVVFPGDRGDPGDYDAWTLLPAQPVAIRSVPPLDASRTLRLLRPDDPLFAGLRLPPGSAPTLAVTRRLEFGPIHPDGQILLVMGEQQPFLLARRVGRGRILLCAVPADRSWSTFPLSPFYLPLLHRMALFSTGAGAARLYLEPAPVLDVTDLLFGLPDPLDVTAPGGSILSIRFVTEEGREARILEQASEIGIYRMTSSEEPLLALNMPREESDLTPVDPERLRRHPWLKGAVVAKSREELNQQVTAHRLGRPLAELFLWLALLTAALETLLAARACRRVPPLSTQLSLDPSGRLVPTPPRQPAP